ncbi:MAG: hypothetical protein PSV16_14660 [Flavobacterium sp.]|nr:hypothetical protein [Flavobacterium sp.]
MAIKKPTTRDGLKEYFKTGERPSQEQFAELFDSYTHLNELNFGITATSTADTENQYYRFYKAIDLKNPIGYITVKAEEEEEGIIEEFEPFSEAPQNDILKKDMAKTAETEAPEGYRHVLSRRIYYKKIAVKISKSIDLATYSPVIIIERYRQSKKNKNGLRPKGYLQENERDATKAQRKSEYPVTGHDMVIDLEPIHYFSPADKYQNFTPSGSLKKKGSFVMTSQSKPFELARLSLKIKINGISYRSQPIHFRIVLGTSHDADPINFIFG